MAWYRLDLFNTCEPEHTWVHCKHCFIAFTTFDPGMSLPTIQTLFYRRLNAKLIHNIESLTKCIEMECSTVRINVCWFELHRPSGMDSTQRRPARRQFTRMRTIKRMEYYYFIDFVWTSYNVASIILIEILDRRHLHQIQNARVLNGSNQSSVVHCPIRTRCHKKQCVRQFRRDNVGILIFASVYRRRVRARLHHRTHVMLMWYEKGKQ